jgi:arsenite-transporting ATPase
MFVINAEKLPIDETKKAIDILEKYNILVDGVVVNKILPDDLTDKFWISKKRDEKKYLEIIKETFKGKKIFTLPMLVSDVKADNLELMSEKFDEFEKNS